MPSYLAQIISMGSGPSVGGNYNTDEGDGARAVKEAVSQLGAVATKVLNSPAPMIFPPPLHYMVETTEPLDQEDFQEKLKAVWNASKTKDEEKPFPRADVVRIHDVSDD